jgi:hypothetical protein
MRIAEFGIGDWSERAKTLEKAPTVPFSIDSLSTMKMLLITIVMAGLVSSAGADPVDTAANVVHSTVRGTKKAAETVANGTKRVVEKVTGAVTPDEDARRVDVNVSGNGVDMPTQLKPGKTAFVVKNSGQTAQNFELRGPNVDREFVSAPGPGETKVLHVTLKRGTYTVYSPERNEDDKRGPTTTLRVK